MKFDAGAGDSADHGGRGSGEGGGGPVWWSEATTVALLLRRIFADSDCLKCMLA